MPAVVVVGVVVYIARKDRMEERRENEVLSRALEPDDDTRSDETENRESP
ncbi:MAG: hypothetical protein PGN07_00635 [Aeromicrobium erythreum]